MSGVLYIAGAIAHGAYNPGLFTSVALFVPVSAWVLRAVVRTGLVRPADVARVVASGVLIHAVLMGSLVLRARGVISHGALLVINALNGLWPLALGARSGGG
jgi:hypothetical protein